MSGYWCLKMASQEQLYSCRARDDANCSWEASMPSTAPHTPAMLGHGETRERRSWAILDCRHRSATLPFVAHCHCIGFLYSARPGYRPHLPLSTKRAITVPLSKKDGFDKARHE